MQGAEARTPTNTTYLVAGAHEAAGGGKSQTADVADVRSGPRRLWRGRMQLDAGKIASLSSGVRRDDSVAHSSGSFAVEITMRRAPEGSNQSRVGVRAMPMTTASQLGHRTTVPMPWE